MSTVFLNYKGHLKDFKYFEPEVTEDENGGIDNELPPKTKI